jgi:hypothetical protein
MSACFDKAGLHRVLWEEQCAGASRRDEKDGDICRLRELHGDVQRQTLSFGRSHLGTEIVVLAEMGRTTGGAAGEHDEQRRRTYSTNAHRTLTKHLREDPQ